MTSSQLSIKNLYNFLLCLLCLIMFGCSVQNIRKTDTNVEKISTGELTFMTFNIRAGGGIKNPGMSPYRVKATKENLMKIAAAINSVDPDIIGLQEVRGFHQGKLIAEQLNLNYSYIPHGKSNWWGLALLSKFRISNLQTKPISTMGDYKMAQICTIPVGEKSLTVINLHVSPSHLAVADSSYEEQYNAIHKILQNAVEPIILLGDLNRKPYHLEIVRLQEELISACKALDSDAHACRHTGFGKIDYVFLDKNNFKVLEVGIVTGQYSDASDHLAFWAKIKLQN